MPRSFGWVGATVVSAVVAIGIIAPRTVDAADPAKQATSGPLRFQHVSIDTSGDVPEACFHFSEALDPRAEAHYGDYVAVEPALTPSVRARGSDLCVAGLAYGTDYKVTLRKGMPAQSGVRTDRDETIEVSLGDRPAVVALSGDGFILPRANGKGLAVETVNVARVKIRLLRMSDRLLPSQLRSAGRYDDTPILKGGSMNRYRLRELLARNSISLVWSGTMDVQADHNRNVETAFPLGEVIKPGEVGAYLIVAEDAAHASPESFFRAKATDEDENLEEGWSEIATHWVISTDIALTAVTAADGLHLFSRSLASADPLPEIKLSLLAEGQDLLAEGSTDRGGYFVFAPGLTRGTGANAPSSVVAYGPAGDFSIIDLKRAAFDLSDRGVSGRPAPQAIEAFLYTERGIYRPGQTVELMTLLRDRVGNAIGGTPLTFVLRRPDGVEANRFTMEAQPEGGFHRSVALSPSAARGIWTLEAYVDPSGSPVGRVEFDVEDFVPQKLKVTLTATTPVLRPGEPIGAMVEGTFLYGAPAAGLTGEAELRITRDPAPVPAAKDYRFGLAEEKIEDQVQNLAMANADDQGRTTIDDVLESPANMTTPLKAVLSAGLFDPGGHIVKDQIELPIRAQPLLIGIKPRFADDRAPEDKDAQFDIRVFDDAGEPIARQNLEWRLIREDHVFDWLNQGGDARWTFHYHVVDRPIASGNIDVAETSPAVLSQPVEWGDYRLVIDDPATQVATSVRFRAGWLTTPESADTPDKVGVTADKPSYAPGDIARIRVEPPFAGKAQLTIAGDRVFETRAVDVPKEGATFSFWVSPDWGPGAYAILSLYRPLDQGRARDPVRAVGVAWLGLDSKPHTLDVAIGAPDKITPRHRIVLPLKLDGAMNAEPTYVTLAAVDEGILQLTRLLTPDPTDFFFGKRRLGIDIRDDYGRLLDNDAAVGPIREGGDTGLGGPSLPVTSTRTVALFSGPVRVAADGTARVELDIPDFEGQLRLMAVAYNHDAVGRGEAKLIVRDPVIADLALPRFLAPDDTARLAVQLHNTDGAAGDYHLALTSAGAARVVAHHPLDYALDAGERKLDNVTLEGLDEGVASIAADLTGPNGYAVHREWQIAVRAAHYPITIEDTALQAQGTAFRLDAVKLQPFIPGSVTVSLGYSGFAGIDVPSLLQSLYQYPYGCTEQMTSTAFPLVYFKDPALLGRLPQNEALPARVQSAIDTILDRQDASGLFGLWRAGDGEASAWLNVYALDFLVHAKEAGFAVPDGALQRGYTRIKQSTRELPQRDTGAYAQGSEATRAYAAFVLARAGRADLGDLRRMHDALAWGSNPEGKVLPASVHWINDSGSDSLADPLSLGYLAGALSLMNDRARAIQTFALASANLDFDYYAKLYPRWWFSVFYSTPTRDLAALAAIAAESAETQLATSLIEQLRGTHQNIEHLNTQEKAWLLRAAHAVNKEGDPAGLAINGQDRGTFLLPVALAPSVAEIASGYEVANRGRSDLWRTLVIHGAPKLAPSAMEEGYTLTKTYLLLDGQPVDPAHMKQNDRVIVSLQGHSVGPDDHRSVLVDLLPAGWEIEAPITDEETYPFLGPLTKAKTIEARDDRFVAAFDLGDSFTQRPRFFFKEQDSAEKTLPPHDYHLAYLVRVVTPGHFTLPEAEVEDMYRPGQMARTEAGETEAEAR